MLQTSIQRIDRFKNGSCRTNRQLGKTNPYRVNFGAAYSVQVTDRTMINNNVVDMRYLIKYKIRYKTGRKNEWQKSVLNLLLTRVSLIISLFHESQIRHFWGTFVTNDEDLIFLGDLYIS